MWIDPMSEKLNLRISGITLLFNFDFRVWSEPAWIHDEGKGSINVFDSDLSLSLNLIEEDG